MATPMGVGADRRVGEKAAYDGAGIRLKNTEAGPRRALEQSRINRFGDTPIRRSALSPI
jgi:hypothetical protein